MKILKQLIQLHKIFLMTAVLSTFLSVIAEEEQSAMQNELNEISDYLSENLFPLVKQRGTFAV